MDHYHLNNGDSVNMFLIGVHDRTFEFGGWRFAGSGTLTLTWSATSDTEIEKVDMGGNILGEVSPEVSPE